ncbi:MAG TPA: sulfonate ABC transporter, partial [Aigarchaeota archaeon]|nr:sulfonate ABC transporter [Aigarchaeota archaeon]
VPDDALSGELFEHAECGAQLELVINEGGMSLKVAEEVAEDWGE